ncbi:shikimate kinase [Insolitispirillum peregrinum]|uniref:Shikimate kinase n=1 Tax=Insolitispirillum peregrinum TaxID=80876 RepID=A0A1N7MRE0_9PROT|nr:shikimate kinase [Insolitispirillum peregrinum]
MSQGDGQTGGQDSPSSGLGPEAPLARSVVLIGLMGAGKSVVGRRLANVLGVPFVDADAAIEEAAGCTIAEIFARFGEPAFREGETRVISRLLEGPPCVLATGGGAYMNEDTRQNIAAHGTAIWLKADLDLLVRRTAGRSHRPLLNQGDPRQILGDLMARRYPVYAGADVVVQVSDESPDATCRRVLNALIGHLGHRLPLAIP